MLPDVAARARDRRRDWAQSHLNMHGYPPRRIERLRGTAALEVCLVRNNNREVYGPRAGGMALHGS